jgi:hypothetical protein
MFSCIFMEKNSKRSDTCKLEAAGGDGRKGGQLVGGGGDGNTREERVRAVLSGGTRMGGGAALGTREHAAMQGAEAGVTFGLFGSNLKNHTCFWVNHLVGLFFG